MSSGPVALPEEIRKILDRKTLSQADHTVLRKFLASRIGDGFSIGPYLQTIRGKFGVEVAQQLCPGIGPMGAVNSTIKSSSQVAPEPEAAEAPAQPPIRPEVKSTVGGSNPTAKVVEVNPPAPPIPNGQQVQKSATLSKDIQDTTVQGVNKLKLKPLRSPLELKNYYYNIQLSDIPGWAWDRSSKKAKLRKAGRIWCKQICYVLTRSKLDAEPFFQRLKIFFKDDDMNRLMEFAMKAVERADSANVTKEPTDDAKMQSDNEMNFLTYITYHMKRSDVPGSSAVTPFGKKGLTAESIRWTQDIIRRIMVKDLSYVDSFLLRMTEMFRPTIHTVFTPAFKRELTTKLLPKFSHNKGRLQELMKSKPPAVPSATNPRRRGAAMPMMASAAMQRPMFHNNNNRPKPTMMQPGRFVTNTRNNNGFHGPNGGPAAAGRMQQRYSNMMMQQRQPYFGFGEGRTPNVPLYDPMPQVGYNFNDNFMNANGARRRRPLFDAPMPQSVFAADQPAFVEQRASLLGQPIPMSGFAVSAAQRQRPLIGYGARPLPHSNRFSPYAF